MHPKILKNIDLLKYIDIKLINNTLPQLYKTTEWKPIIKSVNIKAIKTIGKNFKPKTAGT